MVDFFVRENPLLNPTPDDRGKEKRNGKTRDYDYESEAPNTTAAPNAPVLLDYGEFGFPDEQVMRDWTVVGCLSVIISAIAIMAGVGILGYTIWMVYVERTPVSVDSGTIAAPVSTQGLKRAEVKAFSIDCKWNYPSAMCVTPEGRYLVTAGGPRTRSEDSEPAISRSVAQEHAPNLTLDLEDDDDEDGSAAHVRFLSYDSRPAALPSSIYVDYLNLGKNGKRVIDISRQQQLEAEKEMKKEQSAEMDYTELISVSNAPSLEDLEKIHSLDSTEENSVWKKTRPGVESYPMAFWSMETMQPLVVYWNHEYPIVAIAVSQDGTKVVSADAGGNAILWSLDDLPGENGIETPTWHFVNKMTPQMRTRQRMGKISTIHAVTFTPSGRQFVLAATVDALDETGNSYTTCGALILWDVENWQEVLRKRGTGGISETVDTYYQTFNPVGKYCDLAFTPNGKYLIAAAAGANAGVYYFDNRTNSPAYGICMSNLQPDEQRPRTSPISEFKPNLVQGVSHHDFPNAESVVFAISSENENAKSDRNALTIVSADNYGRIVFWDFAPRTNRPREGVKCKKFLSAKNSENTTRNVRKILFSPDNKYVMFLGDEILLYGGSLPFDYMGTFRSTTNKNAEERSEYFLVSGYFTPDNKYFFGGGDDCMVRMWRMDELPMDSRFISDRTAPAGRKASPSDKKSNGKDAANTGKGKNAGTNGKEETFDDIKKTYESYGGHSSESSRSGDEEQDYEDWKEEGPRKMAPLENNTPITDQVNEESSKIFQFGN